VLLFSLSLPGFLASHPLALALASELQLSGLLRRSPTFEHPTKRVQRTAFHFCGPRTTTSNVLSPHTTFRAPPSPTRDHGSSGSNRRPSISSGPAHDSNNVRLVASSSLLDTLPLRWLPAAAVSVSDRSGSTHRKTPQTDHHRTGQRT